MNQIAVCDDEKVSLSFITSELRKMFQNLQYDINIEAYQSVAKLQRVIETGMKYSAIFLDINMPEMDGITFCRNMQSWNKDTLIVFISHRDELVFSALEVRPFRFIRKSHFKKDLSRLVSDIIKELSIVHPKTIVIQSQNGEIYSVNTGSTVYFEALGKLCRIVTMTDNIIIKYKFSDLVKEFRELGFIQTHRSYIVNYRYIYCIKKELIILENGSSLPMSRLKGKEVREEFIHLYKGDIIS